MIFTKFNALTAKSIPSYISLRVETFTITPGYALRNPSRKYFVNALHRGEEATLRFAAIA
jgi:hypothetical protein